MTRISRALVPALLLLLLLPLSAGRLLAIGEGRILGTVVDEAGNPLPGVKVTVTKAGSASYRQEKTSDQKGKFTVLVLDATGTYTFTLAKEGFATLETPVKPKLEETMRQTFTLARSAPAAPAAGAAPALTPEAVKAGQAVPFFNEGVIAFNGRDMATAGEKFRQALELDPKLAPARAALAEVYMDQAKWPEALAEVDRYLELEPGNARGLRDRYDILKELKDKARADAALEALVAAAPDHDTAVRIFNLGAESSRAGDLDAAIAHLKRALDLDPALDPAYPALAGLYLKKKQYKEAVAVADRQLARDPANLEALTMRYEAFRALGDEPRAKEAQAAMKAASEGGTPETVFKQGVALFNTNNVPQAKAAFERVLKLDPNHAKAHYLLGISQANTGENGPAKEHLKRFLELAPNDPDAAAAKEMLDYLK